MTPFDDNHLIDQLQSGIAERQSKISAPHGIGDNARRVAHKRAVTRAVGAGVPVLAAAGVATVLATSSGPAATTARGPSTGGSPLSAPTAGSVRVENTAYIIKRVKAKIAADRQSSTVVHTQLYTRGEATSNGSLLIQGPRKAEGWQYLPPDGTVSQRSVGINTDGSPTGITGTMVIGPVVNGKAQATFTVIDSSNHTYSQTRTQYSVDPNTPAATPSLQNSPAEVQHELESGTVTPEGTTTVNGTQAIALSVAMPSDAVYETLYVDARTYQPMRTVIASSYGGNSTVLVTDWIPATPDNIAKAKGDSIPAGYTKVDHLNDPLNG